MSPGRKRLAGKFSSAIAATAFAFPPGLRTMFHNMEPNFVGAARASTLERATFSWRYAGARSKSVH